MAANAYFASTYGSGSYDGSTYNGATSTSTSTGGASSSGNVLTNTGISVGIFIIMAALVILTAVFVAFWKRKAQTPATQPVKKQTSGYGAGDF